MSSYRVLRSLGGAEVAGGSERQAVGTGDGASLDPPVPAHAEGTYPSPEGNTERMESEVLRLRGRLERLEQERSREQASWEQALSEREGVLRSAIRDREIASVLAGRPLVAGAAAQLLVLWRDRFDVREEEGVYRVESTDGRPLAESVERLLAAPEFAHFMRPATRGGNLPRGGRTESPTGPDRGPRNLGEAVVLIWREAAGRSVSGVTPMGLRGRR